jgi:hypothetical protein
MRVGGLLRNQRFYNSGDTYAPVNDGDGFSDAPSLDGSIYVNDRRWVAGTIAVTGTYVESATCIQIQSSRE